MIKDIAAGWKTTLENGKDCRYFMDSRQVVYPSIAGSPTFTELTSWNYGSHDFTGGYSEHLYTMPSKFTIETKVYPNFAFHTADIVGVWSWYLDANNEMSLYYNAGSDKFFLFYEMAGTAVILQSQQFDDGTSHEDINQWLTFTVAIDTTTGSTAGSEFWVNRVSQDDAWATDVPAVSVNYNKLQIRGRNGNAGDYKISYMRLFPDYVADDDAVQNGFKNIYNEEIFFPCNGLAIGKTRYNITRFVESYGYTEKFEKSNGAFCANTARLTLSNEGRDADGCFSDDQYAAFAPEYYQLNGTSSQKYLQNRLPLYIESWYGNDFDAVFTGKTTEKSFPRSKTGTTLSKITISAEDGVSDIARKTKKRAVKYDSHSLCDTASESTSLLHEITRLATQEEIYNYLANSSFEKATITNSWKQVTNCTLSRNYTYELFGMYCGKAVFSGAGSFAQTVTFTDITKLNVGASYTFSIYINSVAAPFEGDIKISEYDDAVLKDSTSATVSHNVTQEYTKHTVTHTVTNEDSDRLKIQVLSDAADTIYVDGAMLTYGKRDYNYFVLNNNDGAAGVESADDADYGTYDTVGFIVDDNALVHPWVRIEAGDSIWDYVNDIANATPNLHYFGMDACGNLEYSFTATAAGDPASTETITSTPSVATQLDGGQANKVVISGIKIIKELGTRTIWKADKDGGFDSMSEYSFRMAVGDGATWPPVATYPEYWAKTETL